jgi:hypothetical protein
MAQKIAFLAGQRSFPVEAGGKQGSMRFDGGHGLS